MRGAETSKRLSATTSKMAEPADPIRFGHVRVGHMCRKQIVLPDLNVVCVTA